MGEFDRAKAERVLSGEDPYDEATMLDDDAGSGAGTRRDDPPAPNPESDGPAVGMPARPGAAPRG